MSSIVIAQGVSFVLPNGRELFHGLNFSLGTGLQALVGPNGVGKTTLARLIAGELLPCAGNVRRNGPLTFFPQRREPPGVPVDDFLHDCAWSELGESLLAGIDRSAVCSTLSGGQWMRVRLAATLDDSFLLLDEPTNDLDRAGRALVLRFLAERPGGALLISHDRECLGICDEVLELSNRGLAKFGGGWTDYLEQKERERDRLAGALGRARRDRDAAVTERNEQKARQEKRNRRGAAMAARGGIPKILLGARKRRAQVSTGKIDVATLDRANGRVRALYTALGEIKDEPVMYADLLARPLPTAKLVVEATSFNVRFRDWVFRDNLDFNWRGNVRLALKGGNGSGKSTLLRAILGEPLTTRGELRTGGLATLYIDQCCASLDDEKSVYENVRDAVTLTESEIRTGLARFLFARETVFQKVKDLSGGERLRAALARGLLGEKKPELLILDEPTNNLDLANIEFLERLVGEFRAALIVVSHDEVFLENCGVTQTLVLGP